MNPKKSWCFRECSPSIPPTKSIWLQSSTIIKAQLHGNKFILEKLSIYDRIGTVKVVLASGFVGEASEAQLSPIPSGHLTG